MSASAEDIQKHVKTYLAVFAALLVLTVATVGVSYLHLAVGAAVAVALLVALTKGSLVAAVFMHLSNEVPTIYRLLLLTLVFFVVLMLVPVSWYANDVTVKSVFDQATPAARMHTESHGGH